jgi:hypothetical protein
MIQSITTKSKPGRTTSIVIRTLPAFSDGTRLTVYILRHSVKRSPKFCCSGKATVHSVCVVDQHVTVCYLKILIAAEQCLYGKCVSAATIKHT